MPLPLYIRYFLSRYKKYICIYIFLHVFCRGQRFIEFFIKLAEDDNNDEDIDDPTSNETLDELYLCE